MKRDIDFRHLDAPTRRIPFSLCDYAYAYVREKPWGATFASLIVAQMRHKETK